MSDSPQDVHKKGLGNKGEKSAVKYLKAQGYKILATNYRTPFGEADIIAADGDEVVFTEVKTRTSDSFGTPAEAVVSAKQRRYKRIAQFYWMETGKEPNARFDVLEVYGDGRIEHYKYAF
jgi:putative endonuclease